MRDGFDSGIIRVLACISNNPYEECYQPVSYEALYYTGQKKIPESEVYSRLGRMYFDGLGVTEDQIKACKYLEIAYDKGSRSMRTGDYLMMGVYRQIVTNKAAMRGITKDLRLAIKWYLCCMEKCIEAEDEEGVYICLSHIGRALINDDIRDYKNAFICLRASCHQQAEALFYLARMYDRGLYVKKDRKKAECYIKKIMETPGFQENVFCDCAHEIWECWEHGVPDEIIDAIIYGILE